MIYALLAFLAAPAFAATQISTMDAMFAGVTASKPACFVRSYSAGHLLEHPDQTVREIKVKLKLGSFPGYTNRQYMVGIQVKRKGENVKWTNNISCMDSDEGVVCAVECDGGSVNLVERSRHAGTLILKNNNVLLYGGCGEDSEDIPTIVLEAKPNGDDVFHLEETAPSQCADVGNEAH